MSSRAPCHGRRPDSRNRQLAALSVLPRPQCEHRFQPWQSRCCRDLVDGVDHLGSDEWFSYFSTVSMAAPTRSAATKIRALPKDKQNNTSMSIPHIHLRASSALPARVGEEW